MVQDNNNERQLRIGDIYLINFEGFGNEQRGWRPGLIFQNNTGNEFSPNIIALPLTSSIKKLSMPTHVFLPAHDTGLVKDSVVLCENPECISKQRLGTYLTTLPKKYMIMVTKANILATSAISFLDMGTLIDLWKSANKLNAR